MLTVTTAQLAGQLRKLADTIDTYHEATDVRDGVDVRAYTHIKAPAQRCACGAECTHTNPAGDR